MRRAFTFLELLAVIAILAVLAAILFPVFAPRCRISARQETCRSQVRQLATAFQLYLNDYDQRFPPAAYVRGSRSVTLPALLRPYFRDGKRWGCLTALEKESADLQYDGRPDDPSVSYGYNWLALAPHGIGVDGSRIARPVEVVMLVESTSFRVTPPPLVPALGGTPPAYRHGTTATVGWMDGHVQSLTAAKLELLGGKPGSSGISGIDAYQHWNRR